MSSRAKGDFVCGWNDIGAVCGVTGKTIKRHYVSGNKHLRGVIRDRNPRGKRRCPIALRSELERIKGEVFPEMKLCGS